MDGTGGRYIIPLSERRIDPSVVRTVPIVVALMTSMVMMCLGPPRQMIGFSNVDETCPPVDKQVSLDSQPVVAAILLRIKTSLSNDVHSISDGKQSNPKQPDI